jgi:hypothetical protein
VSQKEKHEQGGENISKSSIDFNSDNHQATKCLLEFESAGGVGAAERGAAVDITMNQRD